MTQKPGLTFSEIANLKLILTVSSAYYAKILPLYRKSLEHRRLRHGRVRNSKGLRVKIPPSRRRVATILPPRAPLSLEFPVLQPTINSRKRPASPDSRGAEPTTEPPCKKLRPLTDATAIDIPKLNMVPLLRRLQDSLPLPSLIVLRCDRWFLIRQRGTIDELPSFPPDLITVKVPPGLRIRRTSK